MTTTERERVMLLPGSTTFASQTVLVTPDIARFWLDTTNSRNRRISQAHVETLTRAILRGEWMFNGEAIKFDYDGQLLDGQHRLAAICEAGKAGHAGLYTTVMVGLAPEVQESIDIGKKRTVGDMLTIRGTTNANHLAAAARFLVTYERQDQPTPVRATPVTPGEVLDTVQKYEDELREGMQHAANVRKQLKAPRASTAGLFVVFHRIDADAARGFFHRYATGLGTTEIDPVYVLRRFVSNNRDLGTRSVLYAAMVIKAWNAVREGRSVTQLAWRPGNNEPFPRAI